MGRGVGRVGSTGSAHKTPRNLIRDKERTERENRAEQAEQERRERAAWEAKRRRDERMTQYQIDYDTFVFRQAQKEVKIDDTKLDAYELEKSMQEFRDNAPEGADLVKLRAAIEETKSFLKKNPS
ncbi:MAG: hypothetical protein ACI4PK_03110 [Oscillospiraceae bacterium]